MIFEYMYELLDEPSAIEMQEIMQTKYRIGGIQLCIDFTMEEGSDLVVRSTEILYVVDTESDIPIMVNKGQKFIIGDYIDYDKVDAECYEHYASESKCWSENYD